MCNNYKAIKFTLHPNPHKINIYIFVVNNIYNKQKIFYIISILKNNTLIEYIYKSKKLYKKLMIKIYIIFLKIYIIYYHNLFYK